jgi:gamma-glutamyltranspeptidase
MKLARDGVIVGPHLAGDIPDYWNWNDGLLSVLTRHNDGKTMLEEGDTMTQPTLAATLEAVMTKGADAIYNGYRAGQLAHDIQRAGGIITIHDLHNYRPTLRSPLIARDVDGFTLVGAPPPSSGGAAIIGAARFLAGYKQSKSQYSGALSKHRMVEAMRHAFSIRMSLSDPSFNTEVTKAAVNDLVRGTYMDELRWSTLDNSTLPLSHYGGEKWAQLNDDQGGSEAKDADEGDRRRIARRFGYLEDHGTSHLSVVDKDGNAVAMTSSVNTLFGSGVVSESTGIFLNSQMDDFSTPGKPNYYGTICHVLLWVRNFIVELESELLYDEVVA